MLTCSKEVPPYDSAAETTLVAEADLTIDILAAMAKNKEGLTAVRAEKDGQ